MAESGRLDLADAIEHGGRAIRFGRIGPETGRHVFLLHGTPFSSQVWRRIAPLLATDRPVVFHDLLGYGESDMPDGDVSLGVQNGAFAALVRHLGVDRPDVVAHDFGGATALRAHFIDGVEYNSLTLVDAVSVRPWGSPLARHAREHEAAFAGMPGYMHRAILRDYLQTAAFSPLGEEAQAIYAAPWLGETGQAAFYRQIAQMDERHTDQVEPRYGSLRCPAQILWGENDEWLPIDLGQSLADRIPGARLQRVPRCGHLMQEDRPEAIAYALRAFLD